MTCEGPFLPRLFYGSVLVLKFESIRIAFCNFCKWLFCRRDLLVLPTMSMEFKVEFKMGNFSCAEFGAK